MSEPPIPQAEEGIALGRVIATGLACLAVGALSLVVVYALLGPEDALGRGAYGRSDSTPSQALFERAGEAPPRPEAGQVLDSYGWVDRDAGIARIPIDEAMKLIVEQAP